MGKKFPTLKSVKIMLIEVDMLEFYDILTSVKIRREKLKLAMEANKELKDECEIKIELLNNLLTKLAQYVKSN